MRKSLLAAAIAIAAANPAAADEWFVDAHYPDQAALIRAAALFQHVIVDAKTQTLRVDTDDAGIAALEEAGLTVTINQADTARLRDFEATLRDAIQSRRPWFTDGGYPSIPGYACYRTVEGTYQTMDDLVAAHPNLAHVDEIGPSWQKTQNAATGYEMRAFRVTNLATIAADPDRPKMVVFGSIHAREYTPAELLTRMAEWLVNSYGTDPQATWLVDHVDFRFVLQANPDGRKKAESGISWRKNTDTVNGYCSNTNSSGIDLNRNFPFHWNSTNGQGSSGSKCDETYRGPTAASEQETQNLVGYVAGTLSNGTYSGGVFPDRRPDDVSVASPDDYAGLFMDIHSYSQLVVWPWGDTQSPAPNRNALQTLGRRLAWFNNYTPSQSWAPGVLYPTDGATDDGFYGSLGVPAYTIELGVNFFESCTTFTNTTYPKNLAALKYAARSTSAAFKLPTGPDAYNLAATTPAEGAGGLYTTVSATIDDVRYNQTNGTQATYAIKGANAYVDTLPWAAGAVPIALAASDGAFNATTENVTGNISLDGLAPGRHIVYVQGVNTYNGGNGTPGTPDAVFVDVPEPAGKVTVTPQVAGDGSIDPSTPQTVAAGTVLQFTASPATGHHTTSVDGCPGTFVAPVFTTDPLQASCTLVATFNIDEYTIGGTIAGLDANGLVLQLNGGGDLAIAAGTTTFAFPTPLTYGSPYDVTIATQPANQLCTVADGSGTANADVADIVVTCAADPGDTIFKDGFETN